MIRVPILATLPALACARYSAALLVALLVASPARSQGSDPNDFDEMLEIGMSLYSQGKQELIIRHFFRDRRDGFYVDIGCYHPVEISTTFFLEEHLGWTGIGVDALARFGPLWKKRRPRSTFVNYAVTDESGETITFYDADGISSTERENIKDWEKRRGRVFEPREITVPTITIDDILDEAGVKRIDFLSMDINGTEPTALAGFDIRRFLPELVHIEVHPRNSEKISRYFAERGYRRIDEYLKYDKVNWYFTPNHPDEPPSAGARD